MVFLGLTLYSRIMNTNPLSFLVQNTLSTVRIPCSTCLVLGSGFWNQPVYFLHPEMVGYPIQISEYFFCQATSPNQNSPFWAFLWGLNLYFLLGDRSQDANFDQFLDCHIESYQSAGGPKLNKEARGSFLGMKRGFKTTWNLEPTCWADFEAFEVSVRNRKIVEQGELWQKHDHGNNSEAHSSGNGWSTWLREKRKATSLGPTSSEAMFPSLVETFYFICGYFLITLRKLCSIGHRSFLINALEHSNYGSIILWVPRYTVPDALPSGSFFCGAGATNAIHLDFHDSNVPWH